MESREAGQRMKDALGSADVLASLNKSVKEYLKRNLQTEGEEKAADRIWIHLGVYSVGDNSLMQYGNHGFSFALQYKDGCCVIHDADQEKLQSREYWKGMLETEDDNFIRKEWKVKNSVTDDWVGEVMLVLTGEMKADKILLREKLLLETVMDILYEVLDDIQRIKDIEKLLKKRETKQNVSLIKAYVAKVFGNYKEHPMLSEKACIRLSHERYEGRETPSKIYIGESREAFLSKYKQDGEIIYWENNGDYTVKEETSNGEKYKIEKGKIRYYRKMMELCQEGKCLITCFDGKEANIFGAADEKWLNNQGYQVHIEFKGNGEWYIREGEEEVLCYIKGIYYYSKTGIAHSYEEQLKEEAGLESGLAAEFSEIIEDIMGKQKHGAGMVIVDNAQEIVREFCIRYSRGIVLGEGLDLKNKENRKFLLGMTSVDGMLLTDKKGVCYAFGVILDGKAGLKANPARGSRYNSAVNYIYDKEGSCAVIISEDKTVDIVGESIRRKMSEDKSGVGAEK